MNRTVFNPVMRSPLRSVFEGGVGGSGGAAPAVPAALYAYGPVYNIQNLGTVWQDAARTVPGALDQPVGAVDDVSGQGYLLSQPTEGLRGTLRQHSVTGRYYVECVAPQCLYSAATFVARIPTWGACAASVIGAPSMIFGARRANSQTMPVISADTVNVWGGFIDATAGNKRMATGAGSLSQNVPAVLEALCVAGTNYAAMNGGTSWPIANAVADGFEMPALRVGVNTASTGNVSFVGTTHFYGGFIANTAPNEAIRAASVQWLRNLCGLSDLDGEEYDVFAVGGQSNAVGRGNQVASIVVPYAKGIEYQDGFIKPLADPTRHYAAAGIVSGNASNTGSFLPAFAARYYELTGRKACMVGGGASGIGVTTSAGWGASPALCNALSAKTLAAKELIEEAGGQAIIRGVLFLGGESDGDASVSKAAFKSGLATMHAMFRSLLAEPSMRLMFLSTDQTTTDSQDAAYAVIRDATAEYCDEIPDAHLVMPYQGFEEAGQLIDTVHWSQAALNTAGTIAAETVAALLTE